MSVRISETVSRWIVVMGRRLISEAYGRPWDPASPHMPIQDFSDFGFADNLHPMDEDTQAWLDAMILFVRTISGIVAHALTTDSIDQLTLNLGDEEEI